MVSSGIVWSKRAILCSARGGVVFVVTVVVVGGGCVAVVAVAVAVVAVVAVVAGAAVVLQGNRSFGGAVGWSSVAAVVA